MSQFDLGAVVCEAQGHPKVWYVTWQYADSKDPRILHGQCACSQTIQFCVGGTVVNGA